MRKRGIETFASVYDEHVWKVYGYFGYRLASRQDAEDLTQLTFERALKAWDRFDSMRANAHTWLMAIARNLLVDHYRRQASRPEEPVEPGELGEAALGAESAEELGIFPELERALGCLSERDRELVALRFGADLSGPEIAELTDLRLANVHQILSRSLRRLREALEPGESGQKSESARTERKRAA